MESVIGEFVQDLKALMVKYRVNFQQVCQALVILDLEIEEAKRKVMIQG